MITIGNVIEVCKVIGDASSRLTMLIGEPVELQLITPNIPSLNERNVIIKTIDDEILIHHIINAVCAQHMTSITQLRSQAKPDPLPDARKIALVLLKIHIPHYSFSRIGDILNRDPAAMSLGYKTASEMLKTDRRLRFNYTQTLVKLKEMISHD